MMRGTWMQFADAMREASYRVPDNFNMHLYNDWEGYGMHEMVENFVSELSMIKISHLLIHISLFDIIRSL
jgi:hypothetical protein